MENKNILICGYRSFVASGLYDKFIESGYRVDCFTRGDELRNQNVVTGDINNLLNNKHLDSEYDIVINFIILKDKGVSENVEYIKSLVDFCKIKKVNHFIHFSSIMVYDNNEKYIDEFTKIEINTFKKGYGEVKIETDRYLESLTDLPFKISLIRPGYVLDDHRPCPFIKKLPLGFSIIKGDKKSVQPIVKREDIHKALISMIKRDCFDPVFLFTPNNNITKYQYAKEKEGGIIVGLPKWLILGTAKLLFNFKLINAALFVRIESMYIRSVYNSSHTQSRLNIKF